MRVLVGYASTYGSTREIAQRLAGRLAARGLEVETVSMTDADAGAVAVERFEAAVLGSAVNGQAWLPAGAAFVRAHAGALASRRVWLFSVGTIGEHSSALGPKATKKFQAMYSGPKDLPEFRKLVHPREHRGFAGVIRKEYWPGPARWFFKMSGGTYGDHRPWDEIDAWGDAIARELVGSEPAASR